MKSQKKRAVVGYLDFNRIQLKYFKILLTSLEFINIQDTDIVIFYDLTYNEQIKGLENIQIGYNEARLIMVPIQPPCASYKIFADYPFANSICFLKNQDWLKQYEYLFKTDLDVVFTKKWNSFYPSGFLVGRGQYVNDDITLKKNQFFYLKWGGNKKSYISNVGSSWYGESTDVLNVAELTIEIMQDILLQEFKYNTGEWPSYYKGVVTLYASEIAINLSVNNLLIDESNIDYYSDSNDLASEHSHIHFWHTDKFFSKHEYFNGKYKHFLIGDLDTSIVNQYCLFCCLLTSNTYV